MSTITLLAHELQVPPDTLTHSNQRTDDTKGRGIYRKTHLGRPAHIQTSKKTPPHGGSGPNRLANKQIPPRRIWTYTGCAKIKKAHLGSREEAGKVVEGLLVECGHVLSLCQLLGRARHLERVHHQTGLGVLEAIQENAQDCTFEMIMASFCYY